MEPADLERIARLALRELGAGDPPVTVSAEGRPDRWTIAIGGTDPATITIRAGRGTTPQYIREQIVTQIGQR
jgi:hypothetical protein